MVKTVRIPFRLKPREFLELVFITRAWTTSPRLYVDGVPVPELPVVLASLVFAPLFFTTFSTEQGTMSPNRLIFRGLKHRTLSTSVLSTICTTVRVWIMLVLNLS